MPIVKFPALLASVYEAASRRASDSPSNLIFAGNTFFRSFSQDYFVVDTQRPILRYEYAIKALTIPKDDGTNRFSGASLNTKIPSWGGLYCSLQQQAVVNEAAFYRQAARMEKAAAAGSPAPNPLPRSVALTGRAVLKVRALGPILAADISPHNPDAHSFIHSIGSDPGVQSALQAAGKGSKGIWEGMNDGEDCSIARGIGLGLAKFHRALCVQTVRTSERSALERGDNLIFFGLEGEKVDNLSPVEAYLFPIVGEPIVYPVEF